MRLHHQIDQQTIMTEGPRLRSSSLCIAIHDPNNQIMSKFASSHRIETIAHRVCRTTTTAIIGICHAGTEPVPAALAASSGTRQISPDPAVEPRREPALPAAGRAAPCAVGQSPRPHWAPGLATCRLGRPRNEPTLASRSMPPAPIRPGRGAHPAATRRAVGAGSPAARQRQDCRDIGQKTQTVQ